MEEGKGFDATGGKLAKFRYVNGEAKVGWLDEGGLVRGVFVEVVCGFVDGLRAGGVPDQQSCRGSRHASDEPNKLFHACFPSAVHYQ